MTPTTTLLRSARFIIPVLAVAGIIAELVAVMSVHENGSYSGRLGYNGLTGLLLMLGTTWATRQTGLSAQENQFLMQRPRGEISALYRDVRAQHYAPEPTGLELQRLTAVRTGTTYSSMGLLFALFCLVFPLENTGSRSSYLLGTAGMLVCLAGAIFSLYTIHLCHRFLTGMPTAPGQPGAMGAPQAMQSNYPQPMPPQGNYPQPMPPQGNQQPGEYQQPTPPQQPPTSA